MPATLLPDAVPHPLQRALITIASRTVVHARPQDSLMEAARTLAARRLSCLPVLDEAGRALGLLTESRVLTALHNGITPQTPLSEVMGPVLTLPATLSCEEAYRRCLADNASHLVVVDAQQQVVGVVSETDFRLHLNLGWLAGQHHVSMVMTRVACELCPADTLERAITLMTQLSDAALIVSDGGRPVGMLTLRDVTRLFAAQSHASEQTLAQVMSTPVHTIAADAGIPRAAELMLAHSVRHLVVTDAQGHALGLLCEHDLTRAMALGLMDSTIRQERALMRAMFDAIPDLVWLKDEAGVFVNCNPRFEALLGHRQEHIVGRTDADFFPPERAEFFRKYDLLATVLNRPHLNEEEAVFADGHKELLQTIKTPVRDVDGQLLGVLGIGRDISALRAAENESRQLFEHSPAPLMIYERSSLALLTVNEAFCDLYGYSLEQARQLRLTDLFLPQDREVVAQRVPGLRGLTHTGQWPHLHRSGRQIQIVTRSHDMVYQGRDCRVIAITDVTPLHQRQQRDRRRLSLLENMVRADGLPSLLEQLAKDHEAMFPEHLCAILLLDESGQYLLDGAAPSLPAFYRQALNGLRIHAKAGSCGAAAYLGQRVIVEDINTHPNWGKFRAIAQQAGLRACWSEPIFGAQERVLGTFAVYQRQPASPDADALEHMAFATQLASTLISHSLATTKLKDSQHRLRDILHAIPDLVWLKTPQGLLTHCNAAFAQLLHRDNAQIVGHSEFDLFDAHTAQALSTGDAQVLSTQQAHTSEHGLSAPQAPTPRLFKIVKTPMFDEAAALIGVLAVAHDITESKRHEERLQRVNRAYAFLGGVNEAIVRMREPKALMAEICRIAVDVGGFGLAWIGGLSESGQHIVPQVHAGDSRGYVESLRIPYKAASAGPVNLALRTGQIGVVLDVATDPALGPWRAAALALGYHALSALPIRIGGQVRHCLTVYAHTPQYFDAEQIALLTRLANDIGFALDFSAAEQARRQEQHFREQLIESVAGLFFVLDQQGRLRMWNRRLEEVMGYQADELHLSPAVNYFGGADRALIAQRIHQAFTEGETQVEATLITHSGLQIPYLFVSRRIDVQEEALIVGTGIDISERVNSEKELSRYRQHLEELVATRTTELESVNAKLSREDQRLRAMLALSQKASSLDEDALFQTGLALMMQVTLSAAGCLHTVDTAGTAFSSATWCAHTDMPTSPDSPACQPMLWEQVLHTRQIQWFDTSHATREPSAACCPPGVVRALCVPIEEEERLRFVICTANKPEDYDDADVRELQLIGTDLWRIIRRRRIELALEKAKAEADAANQAKSAFLANMSHEIRTPMNAIIGFAHLMRRDPLSPRQHDHLSKIVDAGRHLSQVIDDVLDFSKIEASKLSLAEDDFELSASLERATDMVRDRAQAKNLSLELSVAPGCPPQLHGDRLRLEQILLNLLSNAVKFTAHGSVRLRVRPQAAQAQDAPQTARLRFEVQDKGIGIAPDQMARLFQPFEQADTSTTRRFGGTGLGLAISQRLATLMGGHIGASSQLGLGSTFWLELPFAIAQVTPGASTSMLNTPTASSADATPLRGLHVLLVEDNPINQEVASALLSEAGARVSTADDGQMALTQALRGRFDLILMDVQMPVMDGLRATAAIRALPGEIAKVPIIAMTANAFEEDRRSCLAAGMNDYLSKPVDPAELRRCLLNWVRPANAHSHSSPPVDTQETLLRARLQALPEWDVAAALSRMQGQWPLLLRTLKLFISHYAALVPQLSGSQALPTLVTLHQIGHSLAGAAATVGATEVHRLARLLEHSSPNALEDAQQPALAAQRLGQALARCLLQLQHAMQESITAPAHPNAGASPASAKPADLGSAELERAQQAIRALMPLLATHDTAAGELFEQHRALLQAALGDRLVAIAQAIQDYDFSIAHSMLAQSLSPLQSQTAADPAPN